MTVLLYLSEPDAWKVETSILDVVNLDDGRVGIVLDRSPFYPQGGGQPGDRGELRFDEGRMKVETTVRSSDRVLHVVAAAAPQIARAGARVTAQIDRECRRLHSRIHTAGEIVCAALGDLGHRWTVVSAMHAPRASSVTVEADLKLLEQERFRLALEKRANALIRANHEVRLRWSEDLQEVSRLTGIAAARLPQGEPIRLVQPTPGFARPCVGTHVRTLAEIGPVSIRRLRHAKGRLKISYDVH